ncbi:hypothetical protein [Kitasatospora indigofera]|nr:hypothetical protein [Kitasatospora indigofera]
MDLTGIAALVALAGIPVSVLVAHWQKRTALQQTHALNQAARESAAAAHQAALAQAEAGHRAALELQAAQTAASHRSAIALAAASHQSALEVARAQARAERDRWLLDARRASYDRFRECLGRFRIALFRGMDKEALDGITYDMHSIAHEVRGIGPSEAGALARDINIRCTSVTRLVGGPGTTREEREEAWSTWITPLREQFSESVHNVMTREPVLFDE